MDDFQEQTIEQKVREHEAIVAIVNASGYTVAEVATAIANMGNLFTVVIEEISERVHKFGERLGEEFPKLFTENFTLEDDWELEGKREIYKLDFKRPNISHQVIDRKPRQLVKKVIH